MNRSTGLEGVHGTTNTFDLERARQPADRPDFSRTMGCCDGATEDEEAIRVHGVCPLSMGIEREDRCE